jgi:hypothetical protein
LKAINHEKWKTYMRRDLYGKNSEDGLKKEKKKTFEKERKKKISPFCNGRDCTYSSYINLF